MRTRQVSLKRLLPALKVLICFVPAEDGGFVDAEVVVADRAPDALVPDFDAAGTRRWPVNKSNLAVVKNLL